MYFFILPTVQLLPHPSWGVAGSSDEARLTAWMCPTEGHDAAHDGDVQCPRQVRGDQARLVLVCFGTHDPHHEGSFLTACRTQPSTKFRLFVARPSFGFSAVRDLAEGPAMYVAIQAILSLLMCDGHRDGFL